MSADSTSPVARGARSVAAEEDANDPPTAEPEPRLAVMARAFARMGEILGYGALEALVRHAAQDEGRRIAEGSLPGDLGHAIENASLKLGIALALQGRNGNRVEIRCALPPELAARDTQFHEFVTGLLEGLINTNLRVRAKHDADVQIDPGEPLLLAFAW